MCTKRLKRLRYVTGLRNVCFNQLTFLLETRSLGSGNGSGIVQVVILKSSRVNSSQNHF